MNWRTQLDSVRWHATWPHATTLDTIPGLKYGLSAVGAAASVIRATQVHGRRIAEVAGPNFAREEKADGLVTSGKELAIGVRTADCVPVLFADAERVMAVHAGWRGLAADILTAALEKMAAPAKAHALIGPAISSANFEVGPEVIDGLQTVAHKWPDLAQGLYLMKGRDDRWHADLQLFSVLALLHSGVPAAQISVLRSCTFANPDLWPSYRRDGSDCAHIVSWIKRC